MQGLDAFDYVLPEDRIAQEPLADRASSKLLRVHRESGQLSHHTFRDITGILRPGDLLVMNDTLVTALRVYGQKSTGAAIEFLLLKELGDATFEALARPGKRLPPGAEVQFENDLKATILEDLDGGRKKVRFDGADPQRQLQEIALAPLPPYIKKPLHDRGRYQTVYADQTHGGSAAAPTAGLHFTPELLAELEAMGVQRATVTLDVGLDTFRPVTADNPFDHEMHGERCCVPEATAEAVARCEGRVIAVGTTAVRTLETFAAGKRRVEPGERVSKLFIHPGFEYQVVDGMFTNFHMPRTTMLLMISALAGADPIRRAYQAALERDYRFLSFGDSMLIL